MKSVVYQRKPRKLHNGFYPIMEQSNNTTEFIARTVKLNPKSTARVLRLYFKDKPLCKESEGILNKLLSRRFVGKIVFAVDPSFVYSRVDYQHVGNRIIVGGEHHHNYSYVYKGECMSAEQVFFKRTEGLSAKKRLDYFANNCESIFIQIRDESDVSYAACLKLLNDLVVSAK